MTKQFKAWINGSLQSLDKISVPLLTHSLHYGTGVFEGIRAYKTAQGPAVFRLHDHVTRLLHSAKVMSMKVDYTPDEIKQAICLVVAANKFDSCYIRPIIWYGNKMGLNPQNIEISLAIAAWPWGKYLGTAGVRVGISSVMRIHPKSSVMTAKLSGHYTNSVLAGFEAKKQGFDEALLLDYKGNIAEGPGENIFFVKGKTLITPKSGSILPGITRASVMALAKDLGLRVKEAVIKPSHISSFDEAFFTGTAAEISPIISIGKVKFLSTTVSQHIQSRYLAIVRGEEKKYNTWLSFIKDV